MGTGPLCGLLLQGALAGSAALLAQRARALAIVLASASLFGAGWLAGPIVLVRGLCTLIGFAVLFRTLDLVRLRERWGALRRVLHVVSFVDTRTLRRAPPELDGRALGRALLWAAVGAAAFYVARFPPLVVRWGAGLVLAYAAVESLWAFVGAGYRVLGFVTPPLHVSPVASVTVAELWGKRWARPVSAWLRDTCFRPLARRGHPMLGLLLGFLASGIGHAYPVLVALDLPLAASMLAFFAAQGVFVLVEAKLGVVRWPRAAARAWTIAVMVASSPLFVEPALRVLGR